MLEYYELGISYGDNNSYIGLIDYYLSQEDYVNYIKWILKYSTKSNINYEEHIVKYMKFFLDSHVKQIRKIINEYNFNENKSDTCCICYEKSNIKTLCGHYYCDECKNKIFIEMNLPCSYCKFGDL